jgi:iron complex transport system permease protein
LFFSAKDTTEHSIIFDIRLPRILLGLAVGGALGIAGVILQGMFRNPLVEPYTLGISGGASLGVCLNIIFKIKYSFGIYSLPVSGFLGAGVVILLVYFLCTRKGMIKVQWLLLAGVMISFICTSLVMFILAISRSEDLQGIVFWIMGSLGEPNKGFIYLVLAISVLGLIVACMFCLDLNALMLGEEEALHLGINIEKTKKILFVLASLLTGLSVSAAGIIGFVGLAVPHFVRMFVGTDHRVVLFGSFLSGGAFLILCDTIARTVISPSELPVGVITGILGGIVFIYVLFKKKFAL